MLSFSVSGKLEDVELDNGVYCDDTLNDGCFGVTDKLESIVLTWLIVEMVEGDTCKDVCWKVSTTLLEASGVDVFVLE